ncbi:hypothetical protein HH212_25045 [Massilia forsythiae]|uniref:Uncharacterized protein n=1 Tax=Massilia forsythiae TaxID=2728020 RepID=A0A7Z2W163_9BURK|nr:hypothetical protein [Massilia forsythiae]QJE02865.1 hypothetical protein HH212_25045 [Massilia forsythiae]
MRPTDEDQAGSRRPNLMSAPRRSGTDVNILAMLDRHATRPRSKRWLGWPMPAWYGAGGVLACCLIAGLAWAVHDAGSDGGAHDAIAAVPDATAIMPGAANTAAPASDAGTATAPPLPSAARQTQELATQLASQPTPEPAAAAGAAARPAPEPAAAPDSIPSQRSASRHAGQRSATSEALRHALAHGPAPKPHPATPKAHALAHTTLQSSRKETQRARTVPANAKGAAGARPALDTDVALISAIIQHVNTHAQAADDSMGAVSGHKNHETP